MLATHNYVAHPSDIELRNLRTKFHNTMNKLDNLFQGLLINGRSSVKVIRLLMSEDLGQVNLNSLGAQLCSCLPSIRFRNVNPY